MHSALTEANTEAGVSRGLQQNQMCTAAAPCAGASPVRLHTERRDPCLFPTCYGPVALRGRWQFGKPGNELVSLSPRTPTG